MKIASIQGIAMMLVKLRFFEYINRACVIKFSIGIRYSKRLKESRRCTYVNATSCYR